MLQERFKAVPPQEQVTDCQQRPTIAKKPQALCDNAIQN
jgi:hypothetical protein